MLITAVLAFSFDDIIALFRRLVALRRAQLPQTWDIICIFIYRWP